VGAVGEGVHTTITALGDPVNIAARLASAAGPGQILVTAAAAKAAGLDPNLDWKLLELRGKTETIEVVSLRVRSTVPAR
jgi:adenylate cyclase